MCEPALRVELVRAQTYPATAHCAQGYGITLGTINGLNVVSSILQAVPNLHIQVLTLITWMISRFFMYSRCGSIDATGSAQVRQQAPVARPTLPTLPHTAATLQSLATCLGLRTLGSWLRQTTSSTVCLGCYRCAHLFGLCK